MDTDDVGETVLNHAMMRISTRSLSKKKLDQSLSDEEDDEQLTDGNNSDELQEKGLDIGIQSFNNNEQPKFQITQTSSDVKTTKIGDTHMSSHANSVQDSPAPGSFLMQ